MVNIRTDLDEFLPHEVSALIGHGYAKARSALISKQIVSSSAPLFTWDPLNNWKDFNESSKFEQVAEQLDEASRRKWRLWSTHDLITWVTVAALATYVVVAVVAFPAALIALARTFPRVLPFWAPFDASITVRDIRVAKVQDTKPIDAPPVTPALEVQIEFVQIKTGPSPLKECVPELKLADVFRPQPESPQRIMDETQAVVKTTFVVPKNQYARDAALRMVCDRRVTDWYNFSLPEVAGTETPTLTSFLVCTGEFQQACGGGMAWLPCYSNIENWAKTAHPGECAKVKNVAQLSSRDGNKCGYGVFQVSCSSGK